jgi:hypothetical protein
MLAVDKRPSLFCRSASDEVKKFNNIDSCWVTTATAATTTRIVTTACRSTRRGLRGRLSRQFVGRRFTRRRRTCRRRSTTTTFRRRPPRRWNRLTGTAMSTFLRPSPDRRNSLRSFKVLWQLTVVSKKYCGLYYKHVTIVNYASIGVNKLRVSLNDEARVIIYDRHMFIVQATAVVSLARNLQS